MAVTENAEKFNTRQKALAWWSKLTHPEQLDLQNKYGAKEKHLYSLTLDEVKEIHRKVELFASKEA